MLLRLSIFISQALLKYKEKLINSFFKNMLMQALKKQREFVKQK
jgi:hypothetical protein